MDNIYPVSVKSIGYEAFDEPVLRPKELSKGVPQRPLVLGFGLASWKLLN